MNSEQNMENLSVRDSSTESTPSQSTPLSTKFEIPSSRRTQERSLPTQSQSSSPLEDLPTDSISFSQHQSVLGISYASKYFGLDSAELGFTPEMEDYVKKAERVEEWGRREINTQKLIDSTKSFDFIVDLFRKKNGLTELTNPLRVLDMLYTHITKTSEKDRKYDKMKEIQEQLIQQHEIEKIRMKKSYEKKVKTLEERLSEAMSKIKSKRTS